MGRALLVGLVLSGALVGAADDKKDGPEAQFPKDEQALMDLLNKERAKEKLPPLKHHPLLTKVARCYSEELAKREEEREKKKLEVLTHRLDDKGPGDRVAAAGYDYRLVRENLAWGEGREGDGPP